MNLNISSLRMKNFKHLESWNFQFGNLKFQNFGILEKYCWENNVQRFVASATKISKCNSPLLQLTFSETESSLITPNHRRTRKIEHSRRQGPAMISSFEQLSGFQRNFPCCRIAINHEHMPRRCWSSRVMSLASLTPGNWCTMKKINRPTQQS